MYRYALALLACLFSFVIFMSGCGHASHDDASHAADEHAHTHTHEDWWCAEHGMPEQVCALCNIKLVADFKAKGDWCKEHERPDSQCFACHPEKQAEFAAQYEAKYGKQPPKRESDG